MMMLRDSDGKLSYNKDQIRGVLSRDLQVHESTLAHRSIKIKIDAIYCCLDFRWFNQLTDIDSKMQNYVK